MVLRNSTSKLETNSSEVNITVVRSAVATTPEGKGKGRFIWLFQRCGRSAYCVLTLNKFPHLSPKAPRIIKMRDTSTSEGGKYYQ